MGRKMNCYTEYVSTIRQNEKLDKNFEMNKE